MDKSFALGILVGRFQTLHAGHQQMIETALSLCDQVGIFVGSSQESGTQKNPFPYALRKRMLEKLFGDRVSVYPLPDIGVGNTAAWGDYVLENVMQRFGRMPEEARRLDWFDSVAGVRIAELYIPKTVEISASQMRQFLVQDDRESWERYVSPKMHALYPELRALVLASQGKEDTMSV